MANTTKVPYAVGKTSDRDAINMIAKYINAQREEELFFYRQMTFTNPGAAGIITIEFAHGLGFIPSATIFTGFVSATELTSGFIITGVSSEYIRIGMFVPAASEKIANFLFLK